MTDTNLTQEAIMKKARQGDLHLINSAISKARVAKAEVKAALENTKLGDATFSIGTASKGSPRTSPNTIFVTGYSLQADNAVTGEKLGDTIKVKDGTTLSTNDKRYGLFLIADSNKNLNKNVIGLVLSKNHQNVNGTFKQEVDNFEDTDEDLEIFIEANKRAIARIQQLLLNNKYTKIQFPEIITDPNVHLPQRFADALLDMLDKQLGIQAQYSPNKDGGVDIKIQKLNKRAKNVKTIARKEAAIKKAEAKQKELLDSLNAKRPNLNPIVIDTEDFSLLSKVFPDIEQRLAREHYISSAFSRELDYELEDLREYYTNLKDRNAVEEAHYRGLTRGDKAAQRVYALGAFKYEGKPLGEAIFNRIQKRFIDTVEDCKTQEGMNRLVKTLMSPETEEGADFIQEIQCRNDYTDGVKKVYVQVFTDEADGEIIKWTKRGKEAAKVRAQHLVEAYSQMMQPDVYVALCQEAAWEIQFNENLKLSFDTVPVIASEDENTENNGEDQPNANREGYMVKYKLLDPAKTLSINIKTLLGSLFKRDYKNPMHYVFDDLGGKVRMDALTAYRILLDEFSSMKNEDQFVETLDKTIEKYPWLYDLRDILVYNPENPQAWDPNTRSEFYSTMRRAQVPSAMISERGLLKYLNRGTSSADLLANVKANYEGKLVLGIDSIYDATGQADLRHLAKLDQWFNAAYAEDDKTLIPANETAAQRRKRIHFKLYNRQPFGWCINRLNSYLNGTATVAEIKKVMDLLMGLDDHFDKKFGRLSLERLLNDVGVDTNSMNLDSLFGDFANIDEESLEEVKGLDDIATLISNDQIKKLVTILNCISIIVNQTGNVTYGKGSNLLADFQGAYLAMAGALTLASEGYVTMTFRHNGVTRATYTAPDFISDLVDIVKNTDNLEYANEWIAKNYGNFDFFRERNAKGEPIGWANSWLEDWDDSTNDYAFRKSFAYVNMLSFMGSEDKNSVQNVDAKMQLVGRFHAYMAANDDTYGNHYGYYACPSFSDVDAIVMLKGRRFTGNNYKGEILNRLVKNLLQEVDRINDVKNKKENQVEIENYNDKRSKGATFTYFPWLNSETVDGKTKAEIVLEACKMQGNESPTEFKERRDKELKKILQDHLEEQTARMLEKLSSEDKLEIYGRMAQQAAKNEELFSTEENLTEEQDEENNEEVNEKETEYKLQKVDEYLTEYYYNNALAQASIQQLIGGDLAYYKSYQDYIKRNKQAYACGERLFAKETDEQGNIIGDLIEKVMYLEDEDVISNSFESLKNLLMDSDDITEFDKSMIRGTLEAYKKICSTDGQSFRSLDSFRKIFIARGGKWTDSMEDAYRNIKRGTITAADFLALWNPIKPFFYGFEAVSTNGRMEKVTTQHKNSEYMLSALFSMLNTALNKSPKLLGLQQFMEDHGVDAVHFHSVVKVGFNSPFDLNYNKSRFEKALKEGKVEILGDTNIKTYKEYIGKLVQALENGKISQEYFNEKKNEYAYKTKEEVVASLEQQYAAKGGENSIMFKEFPLSSYMIVQPSDDHLIDAEAIFGSQLKNIIMADLPENFTMTLELNGKPTTLNREEAVQFYNTLIVDNLIDAYSAVSNEFQDIHSLQKMLFTKMEGNPQYGEDVRQALQINKEGTGFMLPFNSPNLSNKIEALIFSTFKNAIQRQKIKGGNSVLVSNFGLSDNLHVVYNNGKDMSDGVKYIEAYLPAYCKEMYADFLETTPEGYQTINFKKMEAAFGEKEAEKLLQVIGYRIPTEDKYSIMPIRIVGFMPVVAGTSIMLPSDIITMSGTDFDIDKLFLMVREFKRFTYKPALFSEFERWIGKDFKTYMKEQEAALSEEEAETSLTKSEINILWRILYRNRKQGYTDEDIRKLEKFNPDFSEFLAVRGASKSIKYDIPKYDTLKPKIVDDEGNDLTTDEISKQEALKRNERISTRNNMLIDVIWNTLTSRPGSKLMMQPGNFDRVRQASRQQRIMHNPKALKEFKKQYADDIDKYGLFTTLNSIGADEKGDNTKFLEEFYDKYASPVDPLDVIDAIDLQRNLMDGNALIGMFAVNSSNHYKLQFANIGIHPAFQVQIDGIVLKNLDLQNSIISGERIGRILAEFQAASPDNGKDPCLGDIGANIKTATRIGLLARMGLDPQTIGLINTSEDFYEYSKLVLEDLKLNNGNVYAASSYNISTNKLAELVSLMRTDKEAFEEEMKKSHNQQFAAQYAVFFQNIIALSKSLNSVSKVSRSDSTNGALEVSLPEVIRQYFGAQDFMADAKEEDSPVQGLDKIVDITLDATLMSKEALRYRILKAPIPRLQAAYTLGIKSALTLSARFFPNLNALTTNDSSHNVIKVLRNQTHYRYTGKGDTLVLRTICNELTQALLSYYSEFGDSGENTEDSMIYKRNYYIHDFPMKYYSFMKAHPELKDKYTLLRKITQSENIGIFMQNVGKISNKDRMHYVKDIESLLQSPDPEIVDLIRDLFMYSYYNSGLAFSHNNFGTFFTTAFFNQLPGFVDSLKEGNAKLQNGDFNIYNFVCQFLLNHPQYTTFLNSKQKLYVIADGKLNLTTDGKEAVQGSVEGLDVLPTFVRANNSLWIKVSDKGIYEKCNYNTTNIPYYNMNKNYNEIDWTELAKRGTFGDIKEVKKDKDSDKSKKESPEDEGDLEDPTETEGDDLERGVPQEDGDIDETAPKDLEDEREIENIPEDSEPDLGDPDLLKDPQDEDPDSLEEDAEALEAIEA
jgi:hypothetical protein